MTRVRFKVKMIMALSEMEVSPLLPETASKVGYVV